MSSLTIRHIRAIAEADLDLTGPITALMGPNRAGKTSICRALAAVLTGNRAPITGSKKSPDKIMVSKGAPKGVASLTDGEARALMSWPAGEFKTIGTPPRASEVAAGLVRFTDLSPKERAAAFAEIFPAQPERADLDVALAALGADPASDSLWSWIGKNGWDSAAEQAGDHAKGLKGQWREVTGGKTWGSDAGGAWVPDDWTMALDVVEQGELEQDIVEARGEVSQAVAGAAVAGDRRAELERLVASGSPDVGAIDAEIAAKTRQREAAIDRRRELDDAGGGAEQHPMACWKCGSPIVIEKDPDGGKYVTREPKRMTSEDLKALRQEIAGLDGTVSRLGSEIQQLQADRAVAAATVRRIETAKAELLQESTQGAGVAGDPAEAEARLRQAEASLSMWRAKSRADQLHKEIARNVAITSACGPGGARKAKLATALAAVNQRLAALSEAMGVPAVALDEDLAVAMGERPWVALSGSEQWRCAALVQMEIARHDGSAMVILDGADILDNRGRAGLARALGQAGQVAVVSVTMNAPGADGFKAAGLGRSYWVEGGRAVAMEDAAAAARAGREAA